MKRIVLLIVWLAGTLLSRGHALETYVDGALYVKFKATVNRYDAKNGAGRRVRTADLLPAAKSRDWAAFGFRETATSLHLFDGLANTYRIEFTAEDLTDSLVSVLSALPTVEYVERVPMPYIFDAPDDPLFARTGLADGSWHLNQIGFDKIYGKYQGNPDIKVAVIDNAVWADHPDLNILPENRYFAYVDAVGECAPPESVDATAECATLGNCLPARWSHGTHCAGLIAAVSGNGEGIASFASGVTLMAVRASDLIATGVSKGYEGILWAIDHGAHVISLSWGNKTATETEREIVETAVKHGVVFVAAAGNDNIGVKAYPAAYEGVIAVGAVNSDNSKASFSNYGEWVDVVAPGGYKMADGRESVINILSTTFSVSQYYRLNGETELAGLHYDGLAGTSMATPLTASVIALMLSVNPELTPAEIERILCETATPAVGFTMRAESGVINAEKALAKVAAGVTQAEAVGRSGAGSLRIWPNPASESVFADCGEPIRQVGIYDLTGRLLRAVEYPQDNAMSLSGLPTGVLYLKVETAAGIACGRVVRLP